MILPSQMGSVIFRSILVGDPFLFLLLNHPALARFTRCGSRRSFFYIKHNRRTQHIPTTFHLIINDTYHLPCEQCPYQNNTLVALPVSLSQAENNTPLVVLVACAGTAPFIVSIFNILIPGFRVRCDLKDLQAKGEISRGCSNCLQRGLNCMCV